MAFLVGIPVYNEEKYVTHVISEVQRYADDIVVVDDGSTDATPELLAKFKKLNIIKHGQNQGYGSSLVDIFAYACRNGYEYVITMDCDDQHEPAHIQDFVKAASEADIISGSRYLKAEASEDAPPPDRREINTQITERINEITGYNLTDAFCGFKCYRVAGLCSLQLTEPGYGMPLQLWMQAAKNCLTVKEIPVLRIYGDPNRGFGSGLDDSEARLRYYTSVIDNELKAPCKPGESCCRLIKQRAKIE